MICKVKHYTITIDYDGYLWPREYNFKTFKCIIAFLNGVKSQYYINCPEQFLEENDYVVPLMYRDYIKTGKSNVEFESYMYGMNEARGIYGFSMRGKINGRECKI